MEKTELKFEKCPACGSKERFFEGLCQQVKDSGFASEGFEFYLNSLNGVVLDQSREKSIPVGAEVPGFEVYTDICLGCGTIYAVKLLSGGAEKRVAPTKLALPGRDIPPFAGLGSDVRKN